jgi:hypothetical protein
MGCGHDADVNLDCAAAAERLNFAILENLEQLGLEAQIHIADLVEQNGSTLRCLETALPVGGCAGVGSFGTAEQFTLSQFCGECRAIQLEKWAIGTQRKGTEAPCHHFFAHACLPAEQHWNIGHANPAKEFIRVWQERAYLSGGGIRSGFAGHRGGSFHGSPQQHPGFQMIKGLIENPDATITARQQIKHRAALGGDQQNVKFGASGTQLNDSDVIALPTHGHIEYDNRGRAGWFPKIGDSFFDRPEAKSAAALGSKTLYQWLVQLRILYNQYDVPAQTGPHSQN